MEFCKSVLDLLNEPEGESNLAILDMGRIENTNNLTMKRAIEFDDKEKLAVPINHVLAVVNSDIEAAIIVEKLNKNGFSADEIGVLLGAEESTKLDAATGNRGLFSKLATAGVDAGNRDTDYISKYRRALLNGRAVIAVVANNHETRESARKILKEGNARFITFFGRFATEVLEA
jgi:2,4-dienoyl-CoA reductase-like NADH-dependent reductase (Old Yellow Enzyme family)